MIKSEAITYRMLVTRMHPITPHFFFMDCEMPQSPSYDITIGKQLLLLCESVKDWITVLVQ